MANGYDTDEEIERERQEKLAGFDDLVEANFAPGSFGCHEALHTAHLMADTVEGHILNHPAIVLNAAWYRRAHRAVHEIAALYQEIGSLHSPDRES